MSFVRLYLRVLEQLGSDRRLAWFLAFANVALALAQFAEPVLFGRVINLLAGAQANPASADWETLSYLLIAWVVFGLFTILCGTWVALYADRLSHRRRLLVLTDYFEHILQLPLAYHGETHSGRLMKIMLQGADTLWSFWLGFFREHLAAFVSLFILVPLSLVINWRLAILLIILCLLFAMLTAMVLRKTELGHLPQVQAARAGVGSGEDAFVAPDVAGHQVVTAWDAIVPLGWTVFVQQPIEEAFAPLYASVARTIALVTLGLVIAVAASLVLARRMVRPVQVLQAGAARIGAGALEQRIEIQTGDELEDLAAEFNRMSARLRESYTTLEQKVDDRTKALTESLDENVRLVGDLREASRLLAQASQNKSEFLANMSHELRTPLNAVIGFSDVLLEGMFGSVNERQREYLRDILTSGKHLLSLVNDILDLSKVEAGKMELQPSVFSLREVVESGAMMVRERAINQRIALSVKIDPDLAPVVADERKVKQVLFNLLSNAVKFTPAGGRIEVRACRLDGEVQVSVRDTGVGVAPEDQSRIFEEFQQAKTGARTEESTGLGLTLAKRFIELHGGRLWVESVVGQGSTFTFALPLHPIVAGAPVAVP